MGLGTRILHARHHLRPWSGLLGAGLGWVLSDQIGSNTSFGDCSVMSPLVALLIGLGGIAIAAFGGFLSLRAWRSEAPGVSARAFVAGTGVGAAALFSVAIFLQTAASLVIPRCYG